MSWLKIFTLLSMLGIGHRYVLAEFALASRANIAYWRRKQYFRILVFNISYVASCLAVLVVPFINTNIMRWGLIGYLSIGGIAVVVYRKISGFYVDQRAYFDDEVSELLWREANMLPDALRIYWKEVCSTGIFSSIVITIFSLSPDTLSLSAPENYIAPLLLAGAVIAFLDGRISPFLSIITVAPKILSLIWSGKGVAVQTYNPVTLNHVTRRAEKIVFIMDESVRGDYLTLGDENLDTTPFLSKLGPELINYGVATAAHNCSSYARYIVRHGLRAADLPQAIFGGLNVANPNLYQYAKAAGMRVVYIDGFSGTMSGLHSGTTLQEAAFIDEVVRIPKLPAHLRDLQVAECLLEALSAPGPAYIFVDKSGVHAPYGDKFPPEEKIYSPVDSASPKDQMVASYKNSVRWNVDGFFKRLLEKADLTDTFLLYTSDHGQSLLEGGYALTHCSVGNHIAEGEALVPLFVLSKKDGIAEELLPTKEALFNQTTHFDIFPTLLLAMGFEKTQVEASFGGGLFGLPNELKMFLSGFKTSARWVPMKQVSASAESPSRIPGRQKISAFVISYNRSHILDTCLKALYFVDELIVVDKSSTDNSLQIALKYTDKVVTIPWSPTVEDTRPFALSLCTHDWILFLDDDECLNRQAAEYIQRELVSPEAEAYVFPLRHYILGVHDEQAYYWPERQLRMFKRGAVSFKSTVHEGIHVQRNNLVIIPPEQGSCIHHLSYPDVSDFVSRTNRYTSFCDRRRLNQTGSDLPDYARERIDYWQAKSKGAKNNEYPPAVATMRALYDIMQSLKDWEEKRGLDSKQTFADACRNIASEFPESECVEHSKGEMGKITGAAAFALKNSKAKSKGAPFSAETPNNAIKFWFLNQKVKNGDLTKPTKKNFLVPFALENHTDAILSSEGEYPVSVSYHWLNEDGKIVVPDGPRTVIFPSLGPDEERESTLIVASPDTPGIYYLKMAVVQERVRWFESPDDSSLLRYVIL